MGLNIDDSKCRKYIKNLKASYADYKKREREALNDLGRQKEMFGCFRQELIDSKPPFVSDLMYAMMILSDAQEVISRDQKELARQYINRAKYFIDISIR